MGKKIGVMKEADSLVIDVYNCVSGAAFFQRLLEEWRDGGAQVNVIQAVSDEDYRRPRGLLGKLGLRWRMYPGYAWQCWRAARRDHAANTLRVVTTNPFFAPSLVQWAARARGGRTIHLLYDLYPDALVQAGAVGAGSWAGRRLAALTRHALSMCDGTVFLGERLRAHAESIYGPARFSVVIPVGADARAFRETPPQTISAGEHPNILYCGQMGRMHETDTLTDVWPQAADLRLSWTFHATGVGYAHLRGACAGQGRVTWGGSLPGEAWRETMLRAQVALVTIAPGAEHVVMPSKTYSALAAGQAILAICRRASDLADLVTKHDCGWVVEPGDTGALLEVLKRIADDRAGLHEKRMNAFRAGQDVYDMNVIAREWMSYFQRLNATESR